MNNNKQPIHSYNPKLKLYNSTGLLSYTLSYTSFMVSASNAYLTGLKYYTHAIHTGKFLVFDPNPEKPNIGNIDILIILIANLVLWKLHVNVNPRLLADRDNNKHMIK